MRFARRPPILKSFAWGAVAALGFVMFAGQAQTRPLAWSEAPRLRYFPDLNLSLRAEGWASAEEELTSESWTTERLAWAEDQGLIEKGGLSAEELAGGVPSMARAPGWAEQIALVASRALFGVRLPTVFEVQSLVESRSLKLIDLRNNGVSMVFHVPISASIMVNGGILADFVYSPSVFSSHAWQPDVFYRNFTNMGLTAGIARRDGQGQYLYGRVVIRGSSLDLEGQPEAVTAREPLYVGFLVGTEFDRRWVSPERE